MTEFAFDLNYDPHAKTPLAVISQAGARVHFDMRDWRRHTQYRTREERGIKLADNPDFEAAHTWLRVLRETIYQHDVSDVRLLYGVGHTRQRVQSSNQFGNLANWRKLYNTQQGLVLLERGKHTNAILFDASTDAIFCNRLTTPKGAKHLYGRYRASDPKSTYWHRTVDQLLGVVFPILEDAA